MRYPYTGLTKMVWKQIPINFSSSYLRHVQMKVQNSRSVTMSPLLWNLVLKPSVSIDSRLTFADHISPCCAKAARKLNALSRISKNLDPNVEN